MVALICNRPQTQQNKFITKSGLGWWFANKLDHCPTLFHHVLTVSIAIAFICEVSGKQNLQVPRSNFLSLSPIPTFGTGAVANRLHLTSLFPIFQWGCVTGSLTTNLTASLLWCGCLLPACLDLINCFGISASVGRHSVKLSAGKVQCSWSGPQLYILALMDLGSCNLAFPAWTQHVSTINHLPDKTFIGFYMVGLPLIYDHCSLVLASKYSLYHLDGIDNCF